MSLTCILLTLSEDVRGCVSSSKVKGWRGRGGDEASQAQVTSPTLPQPAPSGARTLEAGERWARLAQARAASRPG